MNSPLAVNQFIPLDELHPAAVARETELDGLLLPGLGWFCLMLGITDLVGNLVGCPIATGLILARWKVEPTGAGLWLPVTGQLLLLLTGMILLYNSMWRRTLADVLDEFRLLSDPSAPAVSGVGKIWNRLVQALPEDAEEHLELAHKHSLSTLTRVGLTVAALLVILNLLEPARWPVILVLIGMLIGDDLRLLLKLLLQRVLSDRSSMTGLWLATALGLVGVFAIAFPHDLLPEFFSNAWNQGSYLRFRAIELLIATILVGWLLLLPQTQLSNDLLIHVSEPKIRTRVWFDLSSFLAFRGRRVIAHLNPTGLRELIVLARDPAGSFVAVAPDQPLHLNRQPYVILYLSALYDLLARKGTSRFTLEDRRGYFTTHADFVTAPRPLAGADLPRSFPPRSLDRLLGLLASEGMTGELMQVAQEAFDDFVESVQGYGEQLDIAVNQLEGRIDDLPLQWQSGLEVRGDLVSLENAQVVTGLTELERKRAAAGYVQQLRDAADTLVQRCASVSELRRTATTTVSGHFESLLQTRYAGNDEAARVLLRHCGLSLRIWLKPSEGHIGHRVQLLERINQRLHEARDWLLGDIDRTHNRLFELLATQLRLRDSREQLVLRSLFEVLPDMLPWFRNRPEQLLQLLEYAVRNTREPSQAGPLLRQLGTQILQSSART